MAKSCKIPKRGGTLTNAQWINAHQEAVRICNRRDVKMHLVCSSTKTQIIVSVRDEIIRLLDSWGWSTPQIGAVLSKNHSSIVIARQRMKGRDPRRPKRPNGVHLGSDRTIGPREVLEGTVCDGETAERQGDGRDSGESVGGRNGGGALGGASEQRPTYCVGENAGPDYAGLHEGT